jgi:hypothetical protein
VDRRFLLYSTGLAHTGTGLDVARYQVYTLNHHTVIFNQLAVYTASFTLLFTSDHQDIIITPYFH